jgi:hypothetical protein
MSEALVENTWNPVKLGGSNKGYTINSYAASTSWYNKMVDTGGARISQLRSYHAADHDSVEISRALDILAEDISSSNADNEQLFNIKYPEDAKIKKTAMRQANAVFDIWNERTEMETHFFNRVRNALRDGISFYRKRSDGSVIRLHSERMIGYILNENDEDKVTHYIYDKTVPRIDQDSKNILNKNQKTGGGNEKYEVIPVDNLIILKVGEGPFGKSVIERVYKVYRQMTLLEDSVVIYRVVRAPERRVYYIDVGNLQGPKREKAIERQRLRLMQKQVNKNGQQTTDYDPHSTSEDIFIPTNSTGKGSRIETLPAGQSLGELRDLEWFKEKLRAGLRIPESMVDGERQGQFSDARVGQIYQAEFRYMGYVKRISRTFRMELDKHYREFAKERGFNIPKEGTLVINDSMSFALYKDIEVNQSLLNVYNSTMQINQMSKKFAFIKYLDFSNEDLAANEEMKLKEKGMTDEQIKGMEQWEIDNIVYGTMLPEIAEKYGLEAGDAGGSAW